MPDSIEDKTICRLWTGQKRPCNVSEISIPIDSTNVEDFLYDVTQWADYVVWHQESECKAMAEKNTCKPVIRISAIKYWRNSRMLDQWIAWRIPFTKFTFRARPSSVREHAVNLTVSSGKDSRNQSHSIGDPYAEIRIDTGLAGLGG